MIIGDPSSFAIELEWEECPPLADDGERATWASIEIRCDGQVLTRYTNGISVHDSILGPASTLAIWLGRIWPELIASERMLHAATARDGHGLLAALREGEWDVHEDTIDHWIETHSLQAARRGMLLPNVILWRRGDWMSVSWCSDPGPRTTRNIQYINSGSALVPARDVIRVLRSFVEAVGRKVAAADEQSATRAAVERSWARTGGPWYEQIDTIAARLGRSRQSLEAWLDTNRDEQQIKTRLVQAYGIDAKKIYIAAEIDSPVARAARSASPAFTDADHERLLALKRHLDEAPRADGLLRFRMRLGRKAGDAEIPGDHHAGYQRAIMVRERLEAATGYLNVEETLLDFGCTGLDEAFDDRGTDGIALWTTGGRALIAANLTSPRTQTRWGRRAMLAHEFYHLLFDASDKRFFGECTSDWSAAPSERAANAFAAELLLPKAALPKDVARYWTEVTRLHGDVAALCEEYQVGRELAVRQLQNRRQLPTPLVDALLGEAGLTASDQQASAQPSASRKKPPTNAADQRAGGAGRKPKR